MLPPSYDPQSLMALLGGGGGLPEYPTSGLSGPVSMAGLGLGEQGMGMSGGGGGMPGAGGTGGPDLQGLLSLLQQQQQPGAGGSPLPLGQSGGIGSSLGQPTFGAGGEISPDLMGVGGTQTSGDLLGLLKTSVGVGKDATSAYQKIRDLYQRMFPTQGTELSGTQFGQSLGSPGSLSALTGTQDPSAFLSSMGFGDIGPAGMASLGQQFPWASSALGFPEAGPSLGNFAGQFAAQNAGLLGGLGGLGINAASGTELGMGIGATLPAAGGELAAGGGGALAGGLGSLGMAVGWPFLAGSLMDLFTGQNHNLMDVFTGGGPELPHAVREARDVRDTTGRLSIDPTLAQAFTPEGLMSAIAQLGSARNLAGNPIAQAEGSGGVAPALSLWMQSPEGMRTLLNQPGATAPSFESLLSSLGAGGRLGATAQVGVSPENRAGMEQNLVNMLTQRLGQVGLAQQGVPEAQQALQSQNQAYQDRLNRALGIGYQREAGAASFENPFAPTPYTSPHPSGTYDENGNPVMTNITNPYVPSPYTPLQFGAPTPQTNNPFLTLSLMNLLNNGNGFIEQGIPPAGFYKPPGYRGTPIMIEQGISPDPKYAGFRPAGA